MPPSSSRSARRAVCGPASALLALAGSLAGPARSRRNRAGQYGHLLGGGSRRSPLVLDARAHEAGQP